MRNILITGASGFVGQNLTKHLENYNLIAISRKNGFDYNLIDNDFLDNNKIEIIIHLAGKAHDLKKISNDSEYYEANTDLTISLFDSFLKSNTKLFIYLSSVKAVKDFIETSLTEDTESTPISVYGKSKLKAEKYLLSKKLDYKKKLFILRPCMIHGPGNKGNLNLLYKLVSKNLPWPLGAFENKRSFCSIENLNFIIEQLISRDDISSGIYNIADDEPLSTNQIIELIANAQYHKSRILKLPKSLIFILVKIGDFLRLPFNTENLTKLTENYVVSNEKIKMAIGKELPLASKEGLLKTFSYFKN
jgi:nucleoside-diphosphate-sugar epimerase